MKKIYSRIMTLIVGIMLIGAFTFGFTACNNNGNDNNDNNNSGSTSNTAATPTASPGAGTYFTTQSVTLATTTDGASIHYTTNGTVPTASSALYSSPISISATTTIKAIAIKDGMTNSSVLTSAYTITVPGTAAHIVASIKIGWNLGNTLDATDYGDGWLSYNSTIQTFEKAWGNPVTTKANIDAIKNAGFNAIRIPVSWTKAADSNYVIRTDWMARVTEVVDYAVANDMYILLNTHHDENVFKFSNADKTASIATFRKIWEQIAANFINYNEKLIFEGLNEPRTKGSASEWNGGTAEERANLNEYYQVFVDVVRASGGNNAERFLLINPYGASASAIAMNGLTLPNDTAKDKLIVSFHNYAPYDFALNTDPTKNTWSASGQNASSITDPIDRYYTKFVSKGIPVMIGEFGAMNKDNEPTRSAWAKFYIDYAWKKGIKCFWWDNGVTVSHDSNSELFGLLNRSNNNIIYPVLLKGLMDGTGTPTTPPSGGGGEITPETKTITVNKNEYNGAQHGYQTSLPLSEFLGSGFKVNTGDKYALTYSFTSNINISGLLFTIIDGTPPSYWTELIADDGKPYFTAVTTGTTYTDTVTLTAVKSASGTSEAANQFVFNIGETTGAASAPTLTFTVLSLTKN